MPAPNMQLPTFLATAHTLADKSAAAILPHFRRALAIDNKAQPGSFDPVTIADRAGERVIVDTIKADWPEHGIVGEEYGTHPGTSAYRWIIDPIDGTKAFILGFPLWGTLIGLMQGDQPILGMMNQPFTGERFWSGEGHSTLRTADSHEQRIRTRACESLSDALFVTTHPDMFKAGVETQGFQAIASATKYTRFGGDCYAYCMLAAGHVDIVVEAGLKPYDIAALIPIIENAGGRCTSWSGGSAANGGRVVAAGDPRVHDAAVRILEALG
jgi:histidinol phosphatase-like enzyme (inositol monophosphatase family)